MSPQEIRDHINKQYQTMEAMSNTTFTLNAAAVEIQKDIEETQAKCQHEFVDGVCKWCDASEK